MAYIGVVVHSLTFIGMFMVTDLKFPRDLGDRVVNMFCNCLRPTCRPRSV